MNNRELINFRIPRGMRHELNEVCNERGITRTGFIIHLIHNELIKNMKQREEMAKSRHTHNLPEFFSTSEMEVVNSNHDW